MATRKSIPPKDNANSAVASPASADNPNSSDKNGKKLAPIFCKPIKSTPTPPKSKSPPKKPKYTFPAKYLNAFKGKRNVNLFIQDGLVVWEFAYDLTIMSAIKEHIKGRAWNKNIGVKGHWTCPLESLPEAIALYEHMGRKADSGLKKRAAEIETAFGGASASDAIKMIIRFSLDEHLAESERQCDQASSTESSQILDRPEPSFGSAKLTFLYDAEVVSVLKLTFLYDAEVVSVLKMLPPSERSYDRSTKAWTVDILAIPAALDHLGTLGYTPSRDLQDIVTSIKLLVSTLYGESIDQISTTNTAEDIEVTVKDEPNEESSPSVPGLAPTFSEDSAASVGDNLGIADNTADTTASGAGVKANDSDNNIHQLETAIKGVMSAISKCSGKAGTFSRSDHGDSKRQRLTSSQKSWARRRMGYDDDEDYGYGYGYDFDDDDSDDNDDFFGYSTFFRRDRFASFARNRFDSIKVAKSTKPADCDCGRPDKTIGGIHTCRYFGTFHCRCGNRWTSAYCWKGEKQACRGCNTESLPIKKEPLKNKEGRGVPGGGHHDTARCEMCRKLGYDCSSGY